MSFSGKNMNQGGNRIESGFHIGFKLIQDHASRGEYSLLFP